MEVCPQRARRAAGTTMTTEAGFPLLRLLQLVSPNLPVGGFAYSQGIEWARESGWMRDLPDVHAWLADQMQGPLVRVDLPLLLRLQAAAQARDLASLTAWTDRVLASRETAELRAEESNRGRALADLLVAWGLAGASDWRPQLGRSQAAGFAFAVAAWGIEPRLSAMGYAWSWLEGLVLATVKILPLGQTQGQQVLAGLAAQIPTAVEIAQALDDDEIGACSPALAIASCRHETQYTRLFRS
jgi:urease accessory protein